MVQSASSPPVLPFQPKSLPEVHFVLIWLQTSVSPPSVGDAPSPPLCLSAVGSSRCRGWNRSGQTGEREDVWIDRLIDEQKDEVGLKLRDAEY